MPELRALGLLYPDPQDLLDAVDADADHDVRGLVGDKLNDSERQEVFDAFGPEPDMQPYGLGLRRRLPSILGGDQRWMRMAYSLAFSPGPGSEPPAGPNCWAPDRKRSQLIS